MFGYLGLNYLWGGFSRIFKPATAYILGGRFNRDKFPIDFKTAFQNYNMCPRLAQVVDMTATTVSSLRMHEINKNGTPKKDSAIINLLENQNISKIIEYSVKTLMLDGNAFIIVDGNTNAMPASFKVVPYERFSYQYYNQQHQLKITNLDGKIYTYTRDEETGAWYNGNFSELIVITEGMRPDGVLGASPQQSLVAKLAITVKGDDANANERLTGISTKMIATIENPLGKDQIDSFRKDIANINSGADNAGNMMILNGGGKKIDVKALGHTKKDMEAFLVMQEAKDAIAGRYLIPLTVINETAATFDNMTTGHIVYYQDVILPKFRNIVAGISDCFKRRRYIINFYKLVHDKANTNVLYQTALGEAAAIQMKAGVWSRNQIIKKIEGGEGVVGGGAIYEPHNQPKVVAGETQEDIDLGIEIQQFQNIRQQLTAATVAPEGVKESPITVEGLQPTNNQQANDSLLGVKNK